MVSLVSTNDHFETKNSDKSKNSLMFKTSAKTKLGYSMRSQKHQNIFIDQPVLKLPQSSLRLRTEINETVTSDKKRDR